MNSKLLLSLLPLLAAVIVQASTNLTPDKAIPVPGKAAHFDFMTVDPSMHRILAAHKGAKTLELVDLSTGKLLQSIPVGEAQGVAVDAVEHRYFLGNDGDHSVAVVDSKSLTKTSEIKVDGSVDAIAFDTQNKMIYAAQDDGDHLWVIDPKAAKVIATVSIPGVPEVLEYHSQTNRIYLNIKNKNLVVSIDPTMNKIDATWSTLPVTTPHGLAIDAQHNRLYSAGSNGKIVAIDLKTGKVIASADIAPGVDQIAYDAERQLIYSACKGFISITHVTDAGLEAIGNVASMKGSHTLAVDPASHAVWVSFSDDSHSYVQRFKATP